MCVGIPGSEVRSSSTKGLVRCPLCGYSLVGLPDDHTCPECGFPYERHATLFSQMRWPWRAACIANGMMLLAGVIVLVCRGVPTVWLAGAVGVLGFGWRLLEPKKFVLVSRKWVRLLEGRNSEQRYPTEAIEHATWSRVDGTVKVFAHDGALLLRIPSSVFWSHRRSKALAATITEYACEAASAAICSARQGS